MSLAGVVEHHGDRSPERPAVAYADTTVSYGELRERARLAAGGLAQNGVSRGDVVAVLLHNSLHFVDLMLGAAYLGAIFMPMNWRLASPEIAYIVDHARAVLLVTETELEPLVAPLKHDTSGVRVAHPDELTAEARPVAAASAVDSGDVLRLMYTSGTTARPKGVVITHGNLDAKCFAHVVELGLTSHDRAVIAGPLYHVGALDVTFTTVLYVGGYQRILRRFDAATVLETIDAESMTTAWFAPAMVNQIVNESSVGKWDLSTMRVIVDGGEKMPLPLIERVLNTFPNAWFADAYGLTETVGGDTFLNKGEERRKLGSVGKPVFNMEVRVVDLDDSPVPAGSTGEIVIRGPKVCAGYWRDPDATKLAMRGGWFHTGDIGMLDDEGYLYIVDRLKDMIVSGGENIASLEVERALYEHPDVVEAAVVGRADERWGEVPVAYIAVRDHAVMAEEQIVAFCRERLARYKVPRYIRFVPALPRNPSGKVLKRQLRDRESNAGVKPEG
jgi:acyl-CoA synthetase (AMP-forming)/AMP-acid ligase II